MDGFDGRGSSGADVVHDDYARAFLVIALDALAHAMVFFSFANQETIQLAAGDGGCNYDRVGAHGQAADRLRLPSPGANFFQKHHAGDLRTARVERSGATVDVVVAGRARG